MSDLEPMPGTPGARPLTSFVDVKCGECGRMLGDVPGMEAAAERYLSHLELAHPERFAELEREADA